jgi:hypothetical protein
MDEEISILVLEFFFTQKNIFDRHTLPKGQENDGFDGEEFQHGVEGLKKVSKYSQRIFQL